MDTKIDRLEASQHRTDGKIETIQARLDNKIDRLIYFIVGGLVLMGGLDFYLLKEAQKEFGQKVDSIANQLRQEVGRAARRSQGGLGQGGGSVAGGLGRKASCVANEPRQEASHTAEASQE